MKKDFDKWNKLKKNLDEEGILVYCKPRQIWWCSLGLNVGSEEDGKNDLFERPVLIIKVLNSEVVRVVPLTSKIQEDKNYSIIIYNNIKNSVIVSQIRTISTKRLTRVIGRLDITQFERVIFKLKDNLI